MSCVLLSHSVFRGPVHDELLGRVDYAFPPRSSASPPTSPSASMNDGGAATSLARDTITNDLGSDTLRTGGLAEGLEQVLGGWWFAWSVPDGF